jgi:endoglucanase
MDGYNWTNRDGQPGWPDWQWFDDVFYNIYHTFIDHSSVFGDKPVMIGEFSSCEASAYEQPGQTKSAWIINAFDRIKSADYALIQSFYWFNINKECDWRINSSPESLAAFKGAISDRYFTSHPTIFVYLPTLLKQS